MEPRSDLAANSLTILMVVTGCLNTMTAKWADTLGFDHPFFQSMCMFVGELCCLFVYFGVHFVKRRRRQFEIELEEENGSLLKFNPLVFLPPTCCDVLSTSMMYIGLNLTTASSFQMLRGSVIVFTGLLSVLFLRAHLQRYKWLGIGACSLGLFIVGASDYFFDTNPRDMNAVIIGDLFIVLAQVVVAIQSVTEQKYLQLYDVPPLVTVGLEGLYGLVILSVLCVPMYFIHMPATFSKNPEGRLEDIFWAFQQIGQKPLIALALLLQIISIAFFNFASIAITKNLSATTRMILDNVRTLFIWALSIPLFGEKFIPLQLLGFGLLIAGMFIYNGTFPSSSTVASLFVGRLSSRQQQHDNDVPEQNDGEAGERGGLGVANAAIGNDGDRQPLLRE